MKKVLVVLLFALSFLNSSYAQGNLRIGFNAGIFNSSFYNNGVGVNVEAGYKLSDNFDLTILAEYLTSKKLKKFPDWNAAYHRIPVLFGVKYYIFDYYIKPYVGLEIGASYLNIDMFEYTYTKLPENKVTETISRYNTKEIYFGFGPLIGTAIPVGSNINVSLNARFHIAKPEFGSYVLFTGGLNFLI